MLEKPDLSDETLRACLGDQYGVHAARIAFLPIGNDLNTAVYQVVASDATRYFLKLRGGPFEPASVSIPRFLRDQGIQEIIAPIATRTGQLWTRVDAFAVILFPFVAGQDGFAAPLSERQWIALGVALRGVHAAVVPPSIAAMIPRERYAPDWRDRVRAMQALVEETVFPEPIAAQMAAFLRTRRDEISQIVARAETLGDALRARAPQPVLCHADIHAANLLIGPDDAFYIVDWDTLIFAPKERDLMFIGGGVGGAWNRAEEEAWFYQGYGQTEIDSLALTYYRYERIVEDIAVYSAQLLLTEEGGADCDDGFGQFVEQFLPDNVVAIAYRTDQWRGARVGDC